MESQHEDLQGAALTKHEATLKLAGEWLAGRLVDRLAGWLLGWSVGWLAG